MNKRKKLVVDQAFALFIEKGIQQTSIQDIIERAGISKGTFYNYFTSKNECVSALLEQIRYEAVLLRGDLLIGRDKNDRTVLIEQIALISRMNADRGLTAIFEEILHSGDAELKKLVLTFRLFEFEWLSERLIDVYGEEIRPYSFEAATIFYGINQHISFTARIINQQNIDPMKITSSGIHYLNYIIQSLIHENTSVLDNEKLMMLIERIHGDRVSKEELIRLMDELLTEQTLNKKQLELTEALRFEISNTPERKAVINALLQPFLDSFKGTSLHDQVKEIASSTWLFIKN